MPELKILMRQTHQETLLLVTAAASTSSETYTPIWREIGLFPPCLLFDPEICEEDQNFCAEANPHKKLLGECHGFVQYCLERMSCVCKV